MGLSREQVLRQLERRYAAGEVIFKEGEDTRELYILLDGTIEVRKGDVTIATLSERDTYIGEMSTLLGMRRSATVVAVAPTCMICVPQNKVEDFFAHSPALGMKLARLLAERLRQMNEKYEKLRHHIPQDDDDARKVFSGLINDPDHRLFLQTYCQLVGKSIPLTELMMSMDLPLMRVENAMKTYEEAGLLRTDNSVVTFIDTDDLALQQLIFDWDPV